MSEGGSKGLWSIIETILTISTPILVVVIVIIHSREITRIQSEIENVEAL